MHHSKLLELLRQFNGRQLSRFRDFLASPYFNRTGELALFFQYLAPHAPAFEAAALEKKQVLRKFKTEKPLTEKRLAYLMNQLHQQAEAFLAMEQFQATDFELAMSLLQVWNPAVLPRHYKFAFDRAVQALEQSPWRNAGYYLDRFRLAALRYDRTDLNQHQFSEPLQEASDALDDFYLVEKLRYCWSMANLEYMLNLQFKWNLGDWMLDYLQQAATPLNPTAQIYLAGIRLVREAADTSHFFQLKNLLHEHELRFDEAERKYLYTGLLNYCTRRINRENDPRFSAEYLEVNQKLLEAGLLFENNQIAPWRFLNLVNTGLRNNQPEWVRQFIETYSERLPADYADDIRLTAQAQYHYHRKEYGSAQVLLNQTNPRDVLLAVTTRNLLARIYYESGETELLLAFLEAYRIYLHRQTLLSAQMKQQARNFIDFTRKLARIDRPEADQLAQLRAQLPPATEIFHRDWLLEQLK